ncbi:proto-oncogene tyrosine protein kinase FER, putative [Entamoeba invadens IP1]|uniref:Proto-oncogene tyrosine protein kinase FER, putative n=1 Tax=Entamoeba invadens IP1 TaxID=370355 RepID=A0A0A1UA56_ENTIV|nr:proto-oncogene tyrosine protein kinase FER, putative [Entamoeba invadens IP1]ELP90041.1 proto-oncogene tyrosine protein kinase FER, putative [Entamoeba invadens IP1]|eukprot:XP_004256812.1 proto-oncogene tyrosine protein kinase FER, putative [Entamoeba invadens IP1]
MKNFKDGAPTLHPEDILYDEKDVINDGPFGKVYKGLSNGLPVAIKRAHKQELTPEERANCLKEIALMKKVFHPNIVLFMGACEQTNNVMLVTELLSCNLAQLLYTPEQIPESMRVTLTPDIKLRMCVEMALGISWLNNVVGVVDVNVDIHNFLVDSHLTIKVDAFAFASFLPEANSLVSKSLPVYVSNDEYDAKKPTFASNVYALALIFWQTFSQKPLFEEYKTKGIEAFITDVVKGGVRPQVKPYVPESIVPLIESMWSQDPEKRPGSSVVVKTLQNAVLVNALSDHDALEWWESKFNNEKTGGIRLEMDKPLFFNTIAKDLAIKIPKEDPIYKIFEETNVTPTSFQKSIKFFGKYYNSQFVTKELLDLFHQDYFTFESSREVVESWLDNRTDGYFVVRTSTRSPDAPFVISYNFKGAYKHNRVVRMSFEETDVRYKTVNILTQKEIFATTVVELVDKCIKEGLVKVACPFEKCKQNKYDD